VVLYEEKDHNLIHHSPSEYLDTVSVPCLKHTPRLTPYGTLHALAVWFCIPTMSITSRVLMYYSILGALV